MLATLAVYHSAWHGGRLWDDDGHLTRAGLQSAAGLWRIWFQIGATQQYYPVVHSAFWLQHRLWGDATLGYHIVNITLHAFSAWLVALILRRLRLPGAFLAAVIFALHPIQVESVAWITELKNILSGTCYLAAALAYLRFDERRDRRMYGAALVLFVLALLSKSVTATLPGALLVVFWWQRGRLRWRRDVVPLLPFFVLGVIAGVTTAWIERTLIGAQGREFQFSVVDRGLIAGRAIWFYLGKAIWPSHLIFMYPRWSIDSHVAWQYLYPAGAIALVAALWGLRGRARGPLAAMLFFVGTLFPALGFVDAYPFRYSFVADHFQYLAVLGVVTVVACGLTRLVERGPLSPALAQLALVVVVGMPLAVLTWKESREYVDAGTLYRATLAQDPANWFARTNLGVLGLAAAPAEAAEDFREAIRLNPTVAEAHSDLASALQRLGHPEEAVAEGRSALALDPRLSSPHVTIGRVLRSAGQLDAARREFDAAIVLAPWSVDAHLNAGAVLQDLGRYDEAATEYRNAIALNPASAEARRALGDVFLFMRQPTDAVAAYREGLRLDPTDARCENNLGVALERLDRRDDALVAYGAALGLDPMYADAASNSGRLLAEVGRLPEAESAFRRFVAAAPGSAEAHNDLGAVLGRMGRVADAVAEFREALRLRPSDVDARANLMKATGPGR